MIAMGGGRGARVFVHRAPVDMRKQFDGLAALVSRELGADVLSGDVYLFIGKTRRLAKALAWDGTGLRLLAKRLARGQFAAPWACGRGGETVVLTESELALFFDGCSVVLTRPLSPPPYDASADVLRFT